jgi:hypothetical protein
VYLESDDFESTEAHANRFDKMLGTWKRITGQDLLDSFEPSQLGPDVSIELRFNFLDEAVQPMAWLLVNDELLKVASIIDAAPAWVQ